jgi:DNA-binding transcriptional ArsR family regulator
MGAMAQSSEAGALPPPGLSPAEALPHPARQELDLASVLHALSDPMRLQIVAGLAGGEERTCKSFELPVVKSTCTHHFKVLREAGVIRQRLEGTTKLNSLRRQDLDACFPGLLDAVLRSRTVPGAVRTPADASR